MSYVWTGLTLLFFFSLFMLAFSVFTPKTAWFFKDKSRLRGAILWMSTALVCAVLVNEVGPKDSPLLSILPETGGNATRTVAKPDELPGFSYSVVERVPGEKLVLACTLGSQISESQLKILALKVYASNQGQSYADVFISWRLLRNSAEPEPWAQTDCIGGIWQIRMTAAN